MWLNFRGFRATLDDQAAQAMVIGAAAMTICAVAFVVLAILRLSVGSAEAVPEGSPWSS